MTQENMIKYGLAAAIGFAAFKYGNKYIQGGVIALAATAIGKQVPYVKDVI